MIAAATFGPQKSTPTLKELEAMKRRLKAISDRIDVDYVEAQIRIIADEQGIRFPPLPRKPSP